MNRKIVSLEKLTLLTILFGGFICWSRADLAAEQVKVHNPSFDISVVSLFVAQEKGYFRDEGLEPLFILATPGVGINGLIAGSFDFSAAGGSASTAIARNLPLKVLLIHTFKPGFWIFARENLNPAQLKGKKIAVSTLGSLVHTLAKLGLKKLGVEADKEVAMIAVGTDDVRFLALKSGAVDAAVFNAPTSIKARRDGLKEVVFLGNEVYGLSGGVVTNAKMIETRPETVLKFVTGAVKGLKYVVANREGAIPILVKYMRMDAEMVKEVYDTTVQTFTADGTRGEDFMRSEAQIQAASLGLKELPPPERPFDFSFARKANERLKNWKPQ
ncbi:MAG TPA: ABC transporter substrate-binding protein [Candidatus Binatia bacterium]|nr:ABC transporter substrate-binding protein [Candidatus Binatia bacterium]